jgi:uncharacterized protein YuzE
LRIEIGGWTFDHVSYDREADVLYLAVDEPRPGFGEETPEGHIWRFDEEGQFCGLTLIGIKDCIEAGEPVAITVPQRTEIPSSDLGLATA